MRVDTVSWWDFRLWPTLVLIAAVCSVGFGQSRAAELYAGGFSFSDELGGFRLLSASGRGSSSDPILLVEEIEEAVPVTLVIRRRPRAGERPSDLIRFNLVKVVLNRSRRVWAGFELELQEVLRKPSDYDDGLSFNQVAARQPDAGSDSFSDNNRLFEPYDRILFENGFVDPDGRAEFRVTITDPTPVREFYLVQDPKLLSAGLPARSGVAALGSRF